jgi:hypothetical protein
MILWHLTSACGNDVETMIFDDDNAMVDDSTFIPFGYSSWRLPERVLNNFLDLRHFIA